MKAMRDRKPTTAIDELIVILADRFIDKMQWPLGDDELHTVLQIAENVRAKHNSENMNNER